MPIDDIIENMKLADFCFPLKSALVYFCDQIYFDIEKDISDENMSKMTSIIEMIAQDLDRFVEIQNRQKQNKAGGGNKSNKRQVANNDEQANDIDLDDIKVDINKNFLMLTSFGSFPILYLTEKYVYEVVYPSLTQFFNLNLPIKPTYRPFYKKFISQIQKATNFIVKEDHKKIARDLYKIIKKITQLKDLGCSSSFSRPLWPRCQQLQLDPSQFCFLFLCICHRQLCIHYTQRLQFSQLRLFLFRSVFFYY